MVSTQSFRRIATVLDCSMGVVLNEGPRSVAPAGHTSALKRGFLGKRNPATKARKQSYDVHLVPYWVRT